MAQGEVKVFGAWNTPFSNRVELALKLKGVEHEYVEEDPSNKSPLLLQYNRVHKKVPVFLHQGKPIAESMVLLEYIEEIWKQNRLLPQDPYERAMGRFWAKFIDEKCTMQVWRACWTEGKEEEKAVQEALQNLKTLETAFHGKKYFGGETIGLVDIVANFLTCWTEALQEIGGISLISEENLPILQKWAVVFVNTGVVEECQPTKEKMHAFFNARKEFYVIAAKSS